MGKLTFCCYSAQIRSYELVFIFTYAAKLQPYILLETIQLFSEDLVRRQFSSRKALIWEPGDWHWHCSWLLLTCCVTAESVTPTCCASVCPLHCCLFQLLRLQGRDFFLIFICTAHNIKASRFQWEPLQAPATQTAGCIVKSCVTQPRRKGDKAATWRLGRLTHAQFVSVQLLIFKLQLESFPC